MQGAPRRQARNSARSVFLLPLVLALLALVAFPVFAHGAGIPEYELNPNETEIAHESVKPKSSGGHHSQGSETQAKAHSSAVEGTKSKEPSEGSEREASQNSPGGAAPGNGGNGPSGGENGKSGGKPGGGSPEGKIGNGKEVPGGGSEAKVKPVSQQTESGGGGGSSPVLPILIVVVILAAISIGVVIYRQRKGGSGQDGRVSSPNAS